MNDCKILILGLILKRLRKNLASDFLRKARVKVKQVLKRTTVCVFYDAGVVIFGHDELNEPNDVGTLYHL